MTRWLPACACFSDIPENREVVEGVGFTFRAGDHNDLKRMLDVLVHNPELRRQAVARQRRRIQDHYLWPEIAQSIERAYYDVLGWPGGEPASQVSIGTAGSALPASGMD